MDFPAPTGLAARLVMAMVLRQRLSFQQEAQSLAARLNPPLVVLGRENIPQAGPGVITMNHYTRAGFQAWWMALAVSSVTPKEIHWIMTSAWTDPRPWKAWWWTPLTGWLFSELARIFEFTTMPPMPPDARQAAWRARSVRETLRFIQVQPTALIGLAPEGGDMPGGVLTRPPKGSGRFIALMCAHGSAIHPVAVFMDERGLCLNFGAAYTLAAAGSASRETVDSDVSRQVMTQIAALLPVGLRGEFA